QNRKKINNNNQFLMGLGGLHNPRGVGAGAGG
ncbi:MAG: hypothetical protein RL208_407, partial [Pseudomonadota bacterium]